MEEITEVADIAAPYGKQITIKKVAYDNGFEMLRIRIKEGKRITDMDLDPQTVKSLLDVFSQWQPDQVEK